MGAILRLLRYLVGAALVLGGAGYMAFILAVPLAPGELAEGAHFDLLVHAFRNADLKHLAAGGAAVLVGFLIARAPFSVTFAGKRKRRPGRTSIEQAIEDLASPDPEVRLEAVNELLSAADPSTIPTLIGALGDPTTKVRGQACEALANMTGETFDFVDIAPQVVRAESVAQWEAWWHENEGAILSGTDPRELAGEPPGVSAPPSFAEAAEGSAGRSLSEGPPPATPHGRVPRRKTSKTIPVPEALPPLDDGDVSVGGIEPAARAPGKPGRNVSLGDVIRKKRMRTARSGRGPRPDDAAREAAKSGSGEIESVMPPEATPQEGSPSPDDTVEDLLSDIQIDPHDLPPPDDDDLPPIE